MDSRSKWRPRPRYETTDQDESNSGLENNRTYSSSSDNYIGIGPKPYSYDELAKATRHFSNNKILGEGGFGQVYKGSLDGKIRAIKKLKNLPDVQSKEDLENEIAVVSKVSHKNLVKLVGYCIEGANRLLVLEFFPNLSLSSKLHGSDDLDWQRRMNIAKGSARGLEYLHEHCKPRIIHLDVKPDNILLDDIFEPSVSDFGLALFFSDAATHISKSTIKGTQIYADPMTTLLGKYSEKSDVYSFGVMLLEMITGRRPMHKGIDIVNWASTRIGKALDGEYESFIDSRLKSSNPKEMHRMIFCAHACVFRPPESRPSMKKILLALEGILPVEILCDKTLNEKDDRRLNEKDGRRLKEKDGRRLNEKDDRRLNEKDDRRLNEKDDRRLNEKDVRRLKEKDVRRLTYQQLRSATRGFSENNLIYEGILGDVYVGYLNDVGKVTVKKFHREQADEFKKIKDISCSVHHPNLVNLIGYCEETENRLLVYECFRSISSLRLRLFGRNHLELSMDWPTRMVLALRIAKGLLDIHELYKPLNIYQYFIDDSIFLDDNLEPKFAEYGRAEFYLRDSEMLVSKSCKTSQYVKIDVYFFGVILLKLITGKHQHNDSSSLNDKNLIELMKPRLKKDWPKGDYSFVDPRLMSYDKEEMDRMIECALACVNLASQYRPEMRKVIEVLSGNITAKQGLRRFLKPRNK